jgi:hypothetical protein
MKNGMLFFLLLSNMEESWHSYFKDSHTDLTISILLIALTWSQVFHFKLTLQMMNFSLYTYLNANCVFISHISSLSVWHLA